MVKNGMRPAHPGEVLLEDYIKPTGLSVRAVAMALHVPYSRLRSITKGERRVTADTALRLERYFGSEAQGWMNLQTTYDLLIAEISAGEVITRAITPWSGKVKYALEQLVRQCDMSAAQPADLVQWRNLKSIGREKR